MTQAIKFFSDLLSKYKEGEIIDNEYINELVKHHPEKQINPDNVEWFKMLPALQTYSKKRELSLQYKYTRLYKLQ